MPCRAMPAAASTRIQILGPDDAALMARMCTLFGEAFDDATAYTATRPDSAYLRALLGRDTFVASAALRGDAVVGALAAYVLPKFEQARSEI